MMKGIDVAKWNGVIDWAKVKKAGVEFAVLKVIDKSNKTESSFVRNYAGASAQGLPLDVIITCILSLRQQPGKQPKQW